MLYARLSKDLRKKYIDKLQQIGFILALDKDYIINSPFPFAVDLDKKQIGCLTTASHAALALSNGAILEDNEFIEKVEEYLKEKN